MYIANSGLRVFILDPETHETKYCGSTGIFRVMFNKGKARVILKEVITQYYGLKNDFRDGVQIVVAYSECGDPSIFDTEHAYLVFTNCKVVRSWIPHPVPTRSADAGPLTYWVEIEPSSFTWKELPK